jgi:hypothetical protein
MILKTRRFSGQHRCFAIANLPADAFLLIGPVSISSFTLPFQVGVIDTLQTAGTPPFHVGKP